MNYTSRRRTAFTLSLILLMVTLLSLNVYADEADANVLTYDQAVEIAVEFSRKMEDNDLTIQQLQDVRDRTVQRVMSNDYDYPPGSIGDNTAKQTLLSLVQTDIDLELLKMQQSIEEELTAYAVRQLFLEIQEKADELVVEESKIALEKRKYTIQQLRNQLGISSHFDLSTNEAELNAAQQKMNALVTELDEAKSRLSFLLGGFDLGGVIMEVIENQGEAFALTPVETVMLRRVKTDPFIAIQEKQVEKAEMNLRLYTYTVTDSYEFRRLNLEKAENELKRIKDNLEKTINSRYQTLSGLLSQREALAIELGQMNRRVENVQLYYQVGMVTKTDVDEAISGRDQMALGLNKLENQIIQLMDLYEKPYLAPEYLQ